MSRCQNKMPVMVNKARLCLGIVAPQQENKIVLHNVNVFARPGQKVAFVGATGAGKTTITNLINRFYPLADGKVRYDGININKIKKDDLHLSGEILWKCIRLGVPLSLQFSLIAISCMALQRVVNNFGPVAVAAFTATSRVEQVIHQPYQTLGAALATFSGQNYGAKKKARVLDGYKKSMLMMAIFSFTMLPVMQFFGNAITGLFVKDTEVIHMGATALKITSFFYVFLGIIYVVRGVLNGIGDAFFSLINGITEVIGRFTVPFLLTAIPVIGLWGIWWSVGIVWFMSALTAWLRYLWMKKRIPDSEAPEQILQCS